MGTFTTTALPSGLDQRQSPSWKRLITRYGIPALLRICCIWRDRPGTSGLNATTASPEFKGNQTALSYSVGALTKHVQAVDLSMRVSGITLRA